MKKVFTLLLFGWLINAISTPCYAENEKNFFIVEQSGTAMNAALARKKALTTARNALATLVNGKLESVTRNYSIHDTESGISADFLLQETKTTANMLLRDVDVADESVVQEKDKRYTVYIILKMKKSDLLQSICKTLSEKPEMQGKFREDIFGELWQKDKK